MTRPLCAALLVLVRLCLGRARAERSRRLAGCPRPPRARRRRRCRRRPRAAPARAGAAGPVDAGRASSPRKRRPIAPPICPTASRRGCAGSRCRRWMLNLFTKKNVPLSSWGTGIEFFRRKGELRPRRCSFSYQNMSPPDGNWLGKGHDAGDRHRLRRSSTAWRCWAPTSRSSGTRTSTSGSACTTAPASASASWRGDDPAHQQRQRAVHRGQRRQHQPVPPARRDAERLQHAAAPQSLHAPRTGPDDAQQPAPVRRLERAARAADRQRRRRRRLPAAPGARLGGDASKAASTTPSSSAAPSATRSDDAVPRRSRPVYWPSSRWPATSRMNCAKSRSSCGSSSTSFACCNGRQHLAHLVDALVAQRVLLGAVGEHAGRSPPSACASSGCGTASSARSSRAMSRRSAASASSCSSYRARIGNSRADVLSSSFSSSTIRQARSARIRSSTSLRSCSG